MNRARRRCWHVRGAGRRTSTKLRDATGAAAAALGGVRRAAAGDRARASSPRAQRSVARQLHENGVTYNVYAAGSAPRGRGRSTSLPLIVPAAEWERLAAACASARGC